MCDSGFHSSITAGQGPNYSFKSGEQPAPGINLMYLEMSPTIWEPTHDCHNIYFFKPFSLHADIGIAAWNTQWKDPDHERALRLTLGAGMTKWFGHFVNSRIPREREGHLGHFGITSGVGYTLGRKELLKSDFPDIHGVRVYAGGLYGGQMGAADNIFYAGLRTIETYVPKEQLLSAGIESIIGYYF